MQLRKSAHMIRPGKHVILIQGKRIRVTSVATLDTGNIEITGVYVATNEPVTIRRTPGSKIDLFS